MEGIIGFIIGVVLTAGIIGIRQCLIKRKFEKGLAFADSVAARERFFGRLTAVDKDEYLKVYEDYLAYLKKVAQEDPKRIKLMLHYEQGLGFVKVSFYDFLKQYSVDSDEVQKIKKEVTELTRNPEFKGFPYVEEPLVD